MVKKVLGIAAALTIAGILLAVFLPTNQANAVACSSAGAAQNGITVSPSHGSVFYIDTGVTPKLDAGYIGYRVTNGTGSTQNNLWTEVSTFTGSNLSLANSLDSQMQLPSLANTATGTSYFMLKATGATTSAQGHTLKVYDSRPDLSDATLLYSCTFSFAKVQETIKAAANKLADNGLTSAAAIEVSDSSPELGQLITITTEGQTGQIGAGSSPDLDIIWLTPAAISTWPTRALRLEDVSIVFDGNGNWAGTGDQVTYNDQLLITGANGLTNVDSSEYRATYSFRVIGRPTSTVTAVPVAQIASGTQIKHSDTTATGGTLDLTFSSLAINASLTKSVTSTSGLTVVTCDGSCAEVPGGIENEIYVSVPYRLTAESTTVTTLTIDEFVDTPDTGIIFDPSSATITDIGRTDVPIPDPVYLTSESGLDPRPYHFMGPFTFNSGLDATINYNMWVPVGSYANTAYAKIGDLLIGATGSAKSRITITSTGNGTVEAVADTVDFSISAITDPATTLTSTTATLNGTVDPNGAALLTGSFEYGTASNLAGATSITATTPSSGTLDGLTDPTTVSVNITGLSSGTTYYFRVNAGAASGSILSFTTLAVLADPTVTTQAATSVSTTAGTLNGTINPNLTPVTGIQFIYGTSATLASGNTTATQDDGSGLAALTIGGSSVQAFTQSLTGLSVGTTYYFKLRACTSALTGTYPDVTCSSYIDGSILSFLASSAPTVTTVAASGVGATSATLNGTINPNGASTTTTFTYGTEATLTTGTSSVSSGVLTGSTPQGTAYALSGLTPETTYYFRAVGVNASGTTNGSILSFTTDANSGLARTLAIDGGSYTSTYTLIATPPTITSTPSAGAGTKNYSSSTTGVCTVHATTGVVTFVGAGTCTIGAVIATDGTYIEATASTISFSVTVTPRTYTIDSGSYTSTYTMSATPPTLTSTPTAGAGTKTYSSSTTGVCTINSSSGLVAFVAAGTCTLDAVIATDGTYVEADADAISFSVTLTPRTLTIDGGSYTSSYTTLTTPPTLTSTPSAGAGTKSYSSSTTDVCTINSSTGLVTFVAAGTCTLGASIATDGTYAVANASTVSFSVTAVSRTLIIDSASYAATYTLAATPPTITSTASLGAGTKTYSSSTTGICTVNSSTGIVTFVGGGTCTLGAVIATDGTYAEASASTISFIIISSSNNSANFISPSLLTIAINDGASCTTSREVILNVSAKDANQILLSNDTYFDDNVWITFTSPTNLNWTLPSNSGTHTIYALYKNAYMHSSAVSASIVLDQANGCGTIIPPNEPNEDDENEEDGGGDDDSVGPEDSGDTTPAPTEVDNSLPPSAARLSYDLYIVNPDGTERHMHDPSFAIMEQPSATADVVRFEDKGLDKDFNDVAVLVDWTDWSRMVVYVASVDAGWLHNIRMTILADNVPKSDFLVWTDSHVGVHQYVIVNASTMQGTYRSPAGYINPRGVTPPQLPTSPTPPSHLSVAPSAIDAIVSTPAIDCALNTSITRLLAFGSIGTDVRALQDFMKCRGTFPSSVSSTGFYGPITTAAVAGFQISTGLIPSGFVGELTRAALNLFVAN